MTKTKKVFAMFLTLTTIVWSLGPSLAYALSVTSTTRADTYIEVTFDAAVDKAAAENLANYRLETGTPLVEQPLSAFAPYNIYVNRMETDHTKARIFNIDRLGIPSTDAWKLSVDLNKIGSPTSTDPVAFADVSGTQTGFTEGATTAPVLDSIVNSGGACNGFPCAKVGETLIISGSGYTSSTTAYFDDDDGIPDPITVNPSSFTATTLTVAVPSSGLTLGKVSVDLQNSDNFLRSDSRQVTIYNATFGIVTGTLTRSDGTTGVNKAMVDVFFPGLSATGGSFKTHQNGKFAVGATIAGTYEAQFHLPPTETTEFAPPKHKNISVSLNSVTNIGVKNFVASTSTTGTQVSGKVCKPKVNPTDPCTGLANANVNVHTYDWTVQQNAVSDATGTFKVFIGTTAFATVTIDVEPSQYDRDVLGYRGVINAAGLTLSGGVAVSVEDIFLATENVIGTIKTPTGTVSNANPSPDVVASGVDVELHTADWSVSRWGQTDSTGKFSFGGVPAGTSYVLEIRPPFSGSFSAYAQTTITGLTVNATGVTNLGILRFTTPNVFGTVKSGTTPVQDAWVNLNSPSQWFGASTRSDGTFSFGGVPKGFYNLEVFPPQTGTGAGSATYRVEVEITSLTSNDLGTITFAAPNVVGHVYGPSGTTGQANTWVDLCPSNAPGQCFGGGTDSTGQFNIGVVPDGTWNVNVWIEWGSIYASPGEKRLVIAGGAPTTLDGTALANPNDVIIRLVDPSVNGLTGTVCSPGNTVVNGACSGSSLSNVGVNLRPANAFSGFQWSQTDANGKFAFGNINPGTYDIEIDPWGQSGVSRSTYTITVNADNTVNVGSTTYTGRTIFLFLSSPTISGTLYTPEIGVGHTSTSNPTPDVPVANSWVNLHIEGPMTGPGGWYGGNTDSTGAFSFGGVKPGSNYVLEVEPQWGSAYTRARFSGITFTDTNADGNADECSVGATNDGNPTNGSCDLNTLLGAGATKRLRVGIPNMRGKIVDPTGNAVRDAWIMVHDPFWTQQAGGNTDRNGFFNLGGLSNGTYEIEINLGWGGTQAFIAPSGLTVVIANDIATVKQNNVALTNNTITLTQPVKTLTGKVFKDTNGDGVYTSSTDAVITDARVEAHRDMGGGFFETRVDSNGDYTLKLAGGAWWINIWPDWGFSQPDWVFDEPQTKVKFVDDSSTESKTKNFVVTSSDSTITGVVKTPTGSAVSNAWVDAHKGRGGGNGTNTDTNGRFTLRVPAGTYEIMVFPSTADYGSAAPVKTKVATGETVDVGTISLKSRNAHITGTVTDSAGNAVSNVMVEAWQFDGAGWVMGFSAQNTGQYDLTVSEGTWGVTLLPMSGNYVYQGAPLEVTVTESETKSNNDFVLKLADTMLKISIVDASGTRITDFFGGVWVRDTSVNDMLDFGGVMEDRMEKGGLMEDGQFTATAMGGAGMEQGKFQGGGLVNGYTEIKVPGGSSASPNEYELGVHTPPGADYTLKEAQTVNVVSGTDQEIELTVRQNDSFITGHIYIDDNSNDRYDVGEELTGVHTLVNADSEKGSWRNTDVDTSTGEYSMSVAGDKWFIHAFIDVFMSFDTEKYMVVNDTTSLTVPPTSTKVRNIEVKPLNATISGQVKDSDGVGMANVWVFADYGTTAMVDEFKGPGGPGVGTETDASGNYILNVTGGTYKIGAGIPPWDTRDLLNPDLITVTVADGGSSTGNDLTFKSSDATIIGTITLSGSNQSAFIRAWSDSGGGTGTISLDGTYSLKVTSGDTWHVSAATDVSKVFYESDETDVTTVAGSNTANLVLESRNLTIPDAKTISFDASDSKTIILDDETKVKIPAGSIESSGTVTVTITPQTNAKPDSKDKPIGVAYDFVAKDSNGNEITKFVSDVQIIIPYDEDVLITAGYSEVDVKPKYYNDTTATWENFKSVAQDTTANTFMITSNHFTPGSITGGKVKGSTSPTPTPTPTPSPGGGGGSALVSTAGPTNVSAWINWGADSTVKRTVTLSLSADNATEMLISNAFDFSGATWQTYKTTSFWTLSSGDGEKVVYVKYRDADFNESSVVSDAITLSDEEAAVAFEKDLVKSPDSGAVYLVLNGKKHVFPHLAVYSSWAYPSDFGTVKTISSTDLNSFGEGDPVPFRDGSLFRGTAVSLHGKDASAVFYVDNGKLRPVASGDIYQQLFDDPDWSLVTWVPDDLLSKFEYALGTNVASADAHPNGSLVKYADSAAVYLIENGVKRPFSSWSALTANGYGSRKIFTIPSTETYSDGAVVGALAETLTTPVIAAAFR